MTGDAPARRRFLVPELVQISAMDCGPAALRCVLAGFGCELSYERLREACQTDVDGTSIDALEALARELGYDAEQTVLPVDHLLDPSGRALPAIVVTRPASGALHFVVVWRRVGPLLQIMDPAVGRRWVHARTFFQRVYTHFTPVPAAMWRAWAETDGALGFLAGQLRGLGVARGEAARLLAEARADPSWRGLAALDAAVRMADAMQRVGGLGRGGAARLLGALAAAARAGAESQAPDVPAPYWAARPHPPDAAGAAQVMLKGAVLLRIRGPLADAPRTDAGDPGPPRIAALREPSLRPGREIVRTLREDGVLAPTALALALLVAASGVVFEAVLLRGLLDAERLLGSGEQRIGAAVAVLTLSVALLVVELAAAGGLLRIGRHLEGRLRLKFLRKLPRLEERYLRSRLASDMAQRCHGLHQMRALPELAGQLLRAGATLLWTVVGLVILDPGGAPYVLAAAAAALALPLALQPWLTERDLRVRDHAAALSLSYLDAMLGLIPIRTHGAERSVRREHEQRLVEWARSSLALQRLVTGLDGVGMLVGHALVIALIAHHVGAAAGPGTMLLLAYWALSLPALGQAIAQLLRQYPTHRNRMVRVLEPLTAPEDPTLAAEPGDAARASGGVAIELDAVTVHAGGHTILRDVSLAVPSGSHVAIVGSSGAGKSTLVGLLLGWHAPASGAVRIDGRPLDARELDALRRETAWVDPAVQLWNRPLLANIEYGAGADAAPLDALIEQADLRPLLERLPQGLQTPLGEGGALISGGEGQRVRLARALRRRPVRLAVLDEPFRGLDRERRRRMLAEARARWDGVTLLCVTHDIGETAGFPRVLVVEGGRVIEDGAPDDLARDPGSRYAALLRADDELRRATWATSAWRRMRVEGRRVVDDGPPREAG